MPKLTYKCPICDKQLKLKSQIQIGDEKLFEYTCGHSFAQDITKVSKSELDFTSADGSGKKARHYQEDGIQFILESDFNCIIGDQMRLGKTPQALLALKNKYEERTPVLILVKGANLWQWCREYKTWADTLPNGIFPIIGSKAWIPPGFSAYILSMDTFSKPVVLENLKKISFKLIIVDEAHSFKNTDSNRSQALVDFVAFQNTGEEFRRVDFVCSRCSEQWHEIAKRTWDKRIGHTVLSKSSRCPKCSQYCYIQQQHSSSETQGKQEDKPCGLVLLTGTPILNRAEEYFVPLNLVAPETFPSLESFRYQWLQPDDKGRYSRVKPYQLNHFKEVIKPYLLRREKEDVFTDLPLINKMNTLIEVDPGALKNKYNEILDKLELKLAKGIDFNYWLIADDLMQLRRICGMMKVMYAADQIELFALETASKMAIGIHHESVRDVLFTKLGGEKNCFKLSGADNSERKDWIMRNWEHSNKQFLIINMLAGGVGMDFHYCDNVMVLERQWNSEIESQFEFRFYNPDRAIKKNSTSIEYIIARKTIDEWFFNMIESKRLNVGETVYNHFDPETDVTSLREVIEKAIANRL